MTTLPEERGRWDFLRPQLPSPSNWFGARSVLDALDTAYDYTARHAIQPYIEWQRGRDGAPLIDLPNPQLVNMFPQRPEGELDQLYAQFQEQQGREPGYMERLDLQEATTPLRSQLWAEGPLALLPARAPVAAGQGAARALRTAGQARPDTLSGPALRWAAYLPEAAAQPFRPLAYAEDVLLPGAVMGGINAARRVPGAIGAIDRLPQTFMSDALRGIGVQEGAGVPVPDVQPRARPQPNFGQEGLDFWRQRAEAMELAQRSDRALPAGNDVPMRNQQLIGQDPEFAAMDIEGRIRLPGQGNLSPDVQVQMQGRAGEYFARERPWMAPGRELPPPSGRGGPLVREDDVLRQLYGQDWAETLRQRRVQAQGEQSTARAAAREAGRQAVTDERQFITDMLESEPNRWFKESELRGLRLPRGMARQTERADMALIELIEDLQREGVISTRLAGDGDMYEVRFRSRPTPRAETEAPTETAPTTPEPEATPPTTPTETPPVGAPTEAAPPTTVAPEDRRAFIRQEVNRVFQPGMRVPAVRDLVRETVGDVGMDEVSVAVEEILAPLNEMWSLFEPRLRRMTATEIPQIDDIIRQAFPNATDGQRAIIRGEAVKFLVNRAESGTPSGGGGQPPFEEPPIEAAAEPPPRPRPSPDISIAEVPEAPVPATVMRGTGDAARVTADHPVAGKPRIDFDVALVDLDDPALLPSHNAFTFEETWGYPQRVLQPRKRSGSDIKTSTLRMMTPFVPERLLDNYPDVNQGTPIVGEVNGNLLVEAGNGRVMNLRDPSNGMYAKYNAELPNWVEKYGFNREDLADFGRPLLVRIRRTPMSDEELIEYTTRGNIGAGAALGDVDKARRDSRNITADMMEGLSIEDRPQFTYRWLNAAEVEAQGMTTEGLRSRPQLDGSMQYLIEEETAPPRLDALLQSANAREVFRGFVDKLPPQEISSVLTTTGQLSKEGANQFLRGLYMKVFGEQSDNIITGLFLDRQGRMGGVDSAVRRILPRLVTVKTRVARGSLPESVDISDSLGKAIEEALAVDKDIGTRPLQPALAARVKQYSMTEPMSDEERLMLMLMSKTRGNSSKALYEPLNTYLARVLDIPDQNQTPVDNRWRGRRMDVLMDAVDESLDRTKIDPEERALLEQWKGSPLGEGPPPFDPDDMSFGMFGDNPMTSTGGPAPMENPFLSDSQSVVRQAEAEMRALDLLANREFSDPRMMAMINERRQVLANDRAIAMRSRGSPPLGPPGDPPIVQTGGDVTEPPPSFDRLGQLATASEPGVRETVMDASMRDWEGYRNRLNTELELRWEQAQDLYRKLGKKPGGFTDEETDAINEFLEGAPIEDVPANLREFAEFTKATHRELLEPTTRELYTWATWQDPWTIERLMTRIGIGGRFNDEMQQAITQVVNTGRRSASEEANRIGYRIRGFARVHGIDVRNVQYKRLPWREDSGARFLMEMSSDQNNPLDPDRFLSRMDAISARGGHVNHLWVLKQDQAALKGKRRPSNTNARKYATYAEGKASGLRPLYNDPLLGVIHDGFDRQRFEPLVLYITRLQEQGLLKQASELTLADRKAWRIPEVGSPFGAKWATPHHIADHLERVFGRAPEWNVNLPVLGQRDLFSMMARGNNFLKFGKFAFSPMQMQDMMRRAINFHATLGDFSSPELGGKIPFLNVPEVLRDTVATYFRSSGGRRQRVLGRALDNTAIFAERPAITNRFMMENGLTSADTSIFIDTLKYQMPEIIDRATRDLPKPVQYLDNAKNYFQEGMFEVFYQNLKLHMMRNVELPRQMRRHPDWTDRQIVAEASRVVNYVMSSPGEWQRFFLRNPKATQWVKLPFISINEYRSWFSLTLEALPISKNTSWQSFASFWVGMAVFYGALTAIMTTIVTGSPDLRHYMPFTRDYEPTFGIGMAPDFLRPPLPGVEGRGGAGVRFDMLEQADTPIRFIEPVQATAARLGVFPRTVINQLQGKTFFGEPVEGATSRILQVLMDVMPVSLEAGLQAARRDEGPLSVLPEGEGRLGTTGNLIQASGFNLASEPNTDFRNRWARDLGFDKDYRDLEPYQRRIVLREMEEPTDNEIARRNETASNRGQPWGRYAHENTQLFKEQETRLNELAEQTRRAFTREQRRAILSRYFDLESEIANRRRGIQTGLGLEFESREAETEGGTALQNYYALADEAKTEAGNFDIQKYIDLRDRFMRGLNGNERSYVLRNTNLTPIPRDLLAFLMLHARREGTRIAASMQERRRDLRASGLGSLVDG